MKILTVIGARPQFIKAAVVERALAERLPAIDRVLVHTGQHYDANMSDIFFEQLQIAPPQHHLGIGGLTNGAMTGRLIEKIESVLLGERPELVLVYGDTDSTLAGALAAAKLRIPVAHVEAGLRSFDKSMPEEINRILTDHVSDVLFTPSDAADENLRREGLGGERCIQVGDVMYDACRAFSGHSVAVPTLQGIAVPDGPFILCTLHRAGNTDDPEMLRAAVNLLVEMSGSFNVVFPLHPRTRKCLERGGLLKKVQDHCLVIEPVGYLEMLHLLARCAAVVTDSGGLQKEAFYLGKRCLVLRDSTEWTELVEQGHAKLFSLSKAVFAPETLAWLGKAELIAQDTALYGGGRASGAVADAIAQRYFS